MRRLDNGPPLMATLCLGLSHSCFVGFLASKGSYAWLIVRSSYRLPGCRIVYRMLVVECKGFR